MMAQKAALREVANRKLRSLLAYNESFRREDVLIGYAAPFNKAAKKKSTTRWRGPAKILDIDDTGATVKFQSRTFNMARYCVREEAEE